MGKKSAKVYHSLYSSTEELQVALWTYMFFKLGLNKEKSLYILPLCRGQTVEHGRGKGPEIPAFSTSAVH
jgi:hypothetical protein